MQVEPVFQLAGLEVETVFTEHANHAKEHIRSVTEWSSLDGVVSVGGDGLFNEVLSGALNRTQEEVRQKSAALTSKGLTL